MRYLENKGEKSLILKNLGIGFFRKENMRCALKDMKTLVKVVGWEGTLGEDILL